MSEIITTLGTACFANNPKLKTVKISANITELEDTCFFRNEALTDIIFDAPENLQYIRQHCFGSNVSLKSPFSCKNIIQIGASGSGDPAFSHCINIPYIDFRGRTLDYLPAIDAVDEFAGMPNLKIIVDEDKYEEWMTRYGWCSWSGLICIDENGTKPVPSQLINRNDYLTITALEDNVSIGFTPDTIWCLQYNLTGKEDGWLDFPTGGITLGSTGDQISFKGEYLGRSKIGQFNLPNYCDLSGQIGSSLIPTIPSNYHMEDTYKQLFKDCVGIINAKDLIFGPYLSDCADDYTFSEMFKGCTNLLSAPELTFGTANQGSFFGLFDGCTNLNKIILSTTYCRRNGSSSYVNSVDENTLPDLSSKDEPGYLYINSDNFHTKNHNGTVNILNYAQSHNWVPLTKYADILYWNKDNIGESITILHPNNSDEYTIGGYLGTGVDTGFKITSDSAFPYVCNIFTSPIHTSYDWELVRRNARIYSGETIQTVLNREGINDNQHLQVIIMGTTTNEEI